MYWDFKVSLIKLEKFVEKWNDGLGVGEHLRRPRIFCMFSGSSEMISYGSPNVRLTFV